MPRKANDTLQARVRRIEGNRTPGLQCHKLAL